MTQPENKSSSAFNRRRTICHEFETRLLSGQDSVIEDWLDGCIDRDRQELFLELLKVEVKIRRKRRESVEAKQFIDRFPEYSDLISDVFELPPSDDETVIRQGGDVESETLDLSIASASETIGPGSTTLDASKSNGDIRCRGYVILHEIARGGMGIVYKARQEKPSRIVALKMILSGQLADSQAIQRFRAEADAAAHLQHPNIVPIFEVGEYEGQHYFSMGYVEGGSLADRVVESPKSGNEAATLVEVIAEAVAFAHQRRVIHRDLKPSNILIDQVGKPYITDFGLAKKIDAESSLTGTGQVLGTPNYMSPEQADGRTDEVDHLSDVYSLGAILYYVLTGRPPFQAATPIETLIHVIKKDPVSLRRLNQAVDRDLETICMKCLEKNPARRYTSASALAEDLRRYLAREPIAARPTGRIERGWRWCRRNPLLAMLIGSLVIGLGLTLNFTKQISDAKDAEETRSNTILQQQATLKQRERDLTQTNTKLEKTLRDRKRGLQELRSRGAENDLNQGLVKCRDGRIGHGLLCFVRALETVPPENESLMFSIRTNIETWRTKLNVLKWQHLVGDIGDFRYWKDSPDGSHFLIGSRDTVVICNVLTGLTIGMPMKVRDEIVTVSFDSEDGEVTAVDGGRPASEFNLDSSTYKQNRRNGRIHRWDALTGKETGKPIKLPSSVVNGAISSSGLVSILKFHDSPENELGQVWSLKPFQRLQTLTIDGEVTNTSFFISPDNRYVGVSYFYKAPSNQDRNGSQIWNLESGKPVNDRSPWNRIWETASITGASHANVRLDQILSAIPKAFTSDFTTAPKPIAVSANGRRVATSAAGHPVQIWDRQTRTAVGQPLAGAIQALIHQDGEFCVTRRGRRIWGWYLAGAVPDHVMGISEQDDSDFLDRLRLWVEVATGTGLSTTDEVYFFDQKDWNQRTLRLRDF